MDKLSLKSYGWKCVLGLEVLYVICLGYGAVLSESAKQLHSALFGVLIPGFNWGIGSIVWGAVYLFVLAWIFAWYYVWMHNSSIIRK